MLRRIRSSERTMGTTYDPGTGRIHFLGLAREVVGAVYRHLPRVIVVSVAWSLLAITVVLAAPAAAVAVEAGRTVIDREPFGPRTAVRAFRRFFWRAQVAFVPALVLVDVAWFLWLHAGATGSLTATVGAFLAVDVLVVYCFLLLYYPVFVVERDATARAAAIASAALALRRVRASVGVALAIGSVGAILAFTVAGFVLLAPVLLSTTLLLATRYLSGEDPDVAEGPSSTSSGDQ